MRKFSMFLFLGSLAVAQGGQEKDAFLREVTAGPGFIQEEFVGTLREMLAAEFSAPKAARMLARLRKQRIKPREVVRFMNGLATRSTLKNYFGVGGREIERVKDVVARVVEQKDRSLYFGVLLYAMVKDFDVDRSAEFCKQTCAARTMLSDEQFEQLRRTVRTKDLLRECFKLENASDLKFMRELLARVEELPFLSHPMAHSLGMDDAYRPRDFPELVAGMPGHGDKYKKGEAGGLPFDTKLPPVPFLGSNVDRYFR